MTFSSHGEPTCFRSVHLTVTPAWPQVHHSAGCILDGSASLHLLTWSIKSGLRIDQLSWHLDRDTELEAHRAVRRLAVADAREAANDFALALGGSLGNLITLADPGLLGTTAVSSGPRRSSYMGVATSGSSGASWEESVDIDPGAITISANVEASYEVTID